MSHLGLYYACKFRAAIYLQLWRKTGDAKWQQQAISNAQNSADNWTAYSSSMAKRYRPQRLSRLRNTVSPDMFDDCARFDVVIAGGGGVIGVTLHQRCEEVVGEDTGGDYSVRVRHLGAM
jgi:hypothetical protein